ncbi:hypothetical protein [uncultured Cellulomonas sp.]|uniref:hypothetical protein n=1 Tax=uncultured Cellulomonas sp. TaxID=189682 RepID=UPI0028E58264|nr:hypothetical protein [uncultured Cellulomonas sp.]
MAALERAQEIRIGSDLVGVVSRWPMPDKLYVFTDRVRIGKKVHVLDQHVQAMVEIDGQVFERSRPTMTRMALLSPLPGSALLPGLAMQKTTTSDKRSASFILVHPEWTETVALDPAKADKARPVAHRINAIAAGLASAGSPEKADVAAPQSPSTMGTLHAELERVAQMKEAGLISDEEASALRSRLLGQD